MIILQNKIQNAISQTHVHIRYQCCQPPHILNGHSATDHVDVLPRTSRHLHSHLLWTSLEPGHCHCAVCLMELHVNISEPSVNKSNTGVRTLISHHKRRTLVTLKILFFVEQENAWDFHCVEWERETHRKCVRLMRDAWDLAGLQTAAKLCAVNIFQPGQWIANISRKLYL